MAWNNLKEFRFWANKVLPLVYDDSLSYYEVLCKVVDYINKMLENEQTIYDMYEPFVNSVSELNQKFNKLESTLNASVIELNRRCTALEDRQEYDKEFLMSYIDNINEALTGQLDALNRGYNSLFALCVSLDSQIKSGDVLTLQKSKVYTDNKIIELKKQLAGITSIYVVDPMDGQVKNIQTVIDELFYYISYAAFTCWEFDRRGYTCEYLDSIGYTALDFDIYGKFIFIFGTDYVTIDMIADFVKREELEHYALKTDLEPYALKRDLIIYNPVNGLKNTMQQVIDTLVSFHACGNNCYTLDGLEYTVNQYQALQFTAYEFDFNGIVKKCGWYYSPVTGEKTPLQEILGQLAGLHQMGLTATQFDSLDVDCDTIDTLEYTAFEFDFYGLTFFANESLITVVTGITANQYQNLVVGVDGTLRVLDLS